ncbi:MAG: lamin tail domain-containing protein [Verrucomicrobiales bacterium]
MKPIRVLIPVIAAAVLPPAFSQTTILHYRVSDTDAAAVAGGTVPSVGSADGSISGSGVTLSADIPVQGVPSGAGNRSLTFANSGGVVAPGLQQLLNSVVEAAGGFTYEAWFKYTGGGNVNSIIDYAGTEKLVRNVGATTAGYLNNSAAPQYALGDSAAGDWHYAAVVFTPTSGVDASGGITGNFAFYYDGTEAPSSTATGVTISNFGDSLNRTIGVGMHPSGFGGDFFNGLIYEPRVSLGALTPGQLLYSTKPSIASFTVDPDAIKSGEAATLAWQVAGADSVAIVKNGVGPVALGAGDSVVVMPGATATYTLTATNAEGDSTAEVTLFVDPVADPPSITEFMADNAGVLDDEDGDSSDWIELFNPNGFSLDISGWSLTDDAAALQKWTFAAGTRIPAGGYLIVFASGKDRSDPSGELHANFSLNDGGEYLALVDADGAVAQEFAPEYPSQREDVSYGTPSGGGASLYLPAPTPGEANGPGVVGFVADTKFDINRGFFDAPFDVTVTCATPGATIIYTTDASTPSLSNGTQVTAPDAGTPPAATVNIAATTTLRAAAFLPDHQPSNTDTNTYVFLADVVLQSPGGAAPAGWPAAAVNGQVFDYGMDPNIVNHATWGPQLAAALRDIPSVSIVTDQANLTSATGIYTNANLDGIAWERPASVELINPGGEPGFQVNAGLRIRGGFSRNDGNPKHSFRLFFRREYGPSKLRYPLFGEEGADEFDKVDLRTAQNYAWSNETFNDELHNTFIRDVFHRDTQRDMGQPYTRSRYYHLYLNGQYWGLYQTQERSESAYAETYLGGRRSDWDILKPAGGSVQATDGNLDAYGDLHALALAGFGTDSAYYAVQGKNVDGTDNPALVRHIDVDNLIDYTLINVYCGNTDGPLNLNDSGPNNFYTIRNRNPAARSAWTFLCHDSEHSMAAADHNLGVNKIVPVATGQAFTQFNPRWLSQQLAAHPDYRKRFGDRAQAHFFNGGALSDGAVLARWNERAGQIDLAIIAESARWGDQHNEPPLDKATWETELNWIRNTFFAQRRDIVIGQLQAQGLFPNTAAPSFSQYGGSVPGGYALEITAPAGAIYYTTDGSDPREISETPTTLLAGGSPAKALVPAGDIGTGWRGGAEPFDDAAWLSGNGGIGYENSPGGAVDYSGFIGLPIDASTAIPSTVSARFAFNVADPSVFDRLILRMRYDDGFAAYLNGVLVASANAPAAPQWDSLTEGGATHDDAAAIVFQDFEIANLGALQAGGNILAIHGMNANATSSDFLIDAELVGVDIAIESLGTLYAGPITLTEQTQVRAAALVGAEWSPLIDATFLIDAVPADASNLVISEFSYRPAAPTAGEDPGGAFDRGDFEFVELRNIGGSPVDLTGVTFADGIEFAFAENTVLDPGAPTVIVKTSPPSKRATAPDCRW